MPLKFEDQPQDVQQHYKDTAQGFIDNDLYFCTRLWDAWLYGTMSEDDFVQAKHDEDFINDLAELLFTTANNQQNG
jgi:hypothetical protein